MEGRGRSSVSLAVLQAAIKRQKATTVTFVNGSKESMKVQAGMNDTVKVKVAERVCLQVWSFLSFLHFMCHD